MTITVIGASIGAQFVNGDPNRYEWRVSYEKEGGGLYYHTVSSREAQESRHAIEVANRDLQGLHAQGAKPKAYSVSEAEILDPAAQAANLPAARKAIEAAHGRALRTAAGRVVQIEGGAPPKSAAIVEWDSLDDAVAFYKSKAWADLAPQRDKATKVIQRHAVETEK